MQKALFLHLTKVSLVAIGVMAGVFSISYVVSAFVEPTAEPPDGNVPPPLQVGTSPLDVTGVSGERDITNVNGVVGSNDLFLRGNAQEPETAPIHYGALLHEFYTEGIKRLTIDTLGNVGIGTASPVTELDVVGRIRAESTGGNNVQLVTGSQQWDVEVNGSNVRFRDISGSLIPFTIEGGTATDTLYLDSTDRVGIGTTAPNETLQVAGRAVLRDAGNNPALIISPSQKAYGVDSELVIQSAETGDGNNAPFHISRNALFQTSDDTYRYIDEAGDSASQLEFLNNGDIRFSWAPAGTGIVNWRPRLLIEGSSRKVSIEGNLTVQGSSVCREDGTNCPISSVPNLQAVTDVGASTNKKVFLQGEAEISGRDEPLAVKNNGYYFFAGANRGGGDYVDIGAYHETDGWKNLVLNRDGGNVGIGTSTIPEGHKLEVVGGDIGLPNTNQFYRFGSEGYLGITSGQYDGHAALRIPDDTSLRILGDTGNEKIRVTSDGNVGIGITNPSPYRLAVDGEVKVGGAGAGFLRLDGRVNHSLDDVRANFSGDPVALWESSGNLHASARHRIVQHLNIADADSASFDITTGSAATLLFRVDNNGRMIVGNAPDTGIYFGANAVDPNFDLTDGGFLSFSHAGFSEDFIGYANNTFYFRDSLAGSDTKDPDVDMGNGRLKLGKAEIYWDDGDTPDDTNDDRLVIKVNP